MVRIAIESDITTTISTNICYGNRFCDGCGKLEIVIYVYINIYFIYITIFFQLW